MDKNALNKSLRTNIIYILWYLLLLALAITLLIVVILNPKNNIGVQIAGLVFASLELLVTLLTCVGFFYLLIQDYKNYRKENKELAKIEANILKKDNNENDQ